MFENSKLPHLMTDYSLFIIHYFVRSHQIRQTFGTDGLISVIDGSKFIRNNAETITTRKNIAELLLDQMLTDQFFRV